MGTVVNAGVGPRNDYARRRGESSGADLRLAESVLKEDLINSTFGEAAKEASALGLQTVVTLAIASGAIVVTTILCLLRVMSSGAGLNYVSGSWAALAVDASHGVLYRPIVGPLGYGGTRYMPLGFLLHAAFIKVFHDAVPAGHISELLSSAILLAGVYYLVKWVSGNRLAGAFAATLVLTSSAIQLELVSVRGDLLAAGLNVWGLALCARVLNDSNRRVTASAAGVFFALAALTKFTTLFGLAAGILAFSLSARKRNALLLAATAFGVITTGLAIIYFASDGRVWEVFRASATGGAGLKSILLGPTMWFRVADSDDPWGLAMLPLCAAVFGTLAARRTLELIPVNLIITTAATVLMFGSPGVWSNHLMDMDTAAIVFLVVEISRNGRYRTLLAGALAALCVLATAHIFFRVHSGAEFFSFTQPAPTSMKEDWAKAQSAIHDRGPLLSENPWLPIVSRETPYLLDSFAFRLASERDPKLADDLRTKLESHYFRAVVLVHDPETSDGRQFLNRWDFGPGFPDNVLRYYNRAFASRYFVLYLPREEGHKASR